MFSRDESLPDFKIHWFNKNIGLTGFNKIFTYGSGKEFAIGIFKSLYPDLDITRVEEI